MLRRLLQGRRYPVLLVQYLNQANLCIYYIRLPESARDSQRLRRFISITSRATRLPCHGNLWQWAPVFARRSLARCGFAKQHHMVANVLLELETSTGYELRALTRRRHILGIFTTPLITHNSGSDCNRKRWNALERYRIR
jgi:hypothetical protein